jgi:hypothetical protein
MILLKECCRQTSIITPALRAGKQVDYTFLCPACQGIFSDAQTPYF